MEHFKILFKKYLDGATSEEEETEVLRLLATNQYDEVADKLLEEHGLHFNNDGIHPATEEVLEVSGQQFDDMAEIQEHVIQTVKGIELSRGIRRMRNFFQVAIAASVTAFLITFVLLFVRHAEVVTAQGVIASEHETISLPDGTEVTLNESSWLAYKYTNERRELNLIGEVYFDVAKDPNLPFIINVGSSRVTVVGTAFSVRGYEYNDEIVVSVERGKVKVDPNRREDQGDVYMLTRNQQVVINNKTHAVQKNDVNIAQVLAWKEGISLQEASLKIEEHFDVSVTIKNEDVKKCRINRFTMENKKLEDALKAICIPINSNYKIKGKHVTIVGGSCNPG